MYLLVGVGVEDFGVVLKVVEDKAKYWCTSTSPRVIVLRSTKRIRLV